MRLIRYTLLVLLIGLFSGLQAQDIHWSLYQMSPLTLNPALTGAYEGTARIGGIYRDQARSITSNAFSTPSIYGDAPLLNVGKTDWVGVGGLLFSDQAGEGQLQNTAALASIAYHKSLDKKRNTVLSFGLQGGIVQRRIDLNGTSTENPDGGFTNTGLWFGDEVEQSLRNNQPRMQTSMSRQNGFVDNVSYFDLNAGVLLTTKLNKQTDINIGASLYHILKPKYGFFKGNENPSGIQDPDSLTVRLPMRFQLHGQFNFAMNKKWTLSPGFLYNRISSASELQVQALLGYTINPQKETTLRFGPGYRLGDAFEVLLGVDMKNLRVMASYDVTLSSLSDLNSSVGGFEIAAYYIIKIFKEPVVKPVIFCPRF
ncbi:MAG: PorP/SprF family type IX secretion system membrane protein [Bacteroidota bacterium]